MSTEPDDLALSEAPTEESDRDDSLGSMASLLQAVAAAPGGSARRALRPDQLIGDKYRVVRAIGEGGMGVVYLARDERLDRDVAIKLGTAVAASALERIEREAQALARLSHPHVVTVYEVGTWSDQPYVAMEYVPGGTARQWLAAAPRTARAILTLYLAAGRGLAAAHAAGLVHRDFKPDNVLVGDDGRARVADFGLARGFAATDDEAGAVMGTPAYMAPEQHAGGAVGPAADQFAFAVALWEALAGQRPFAGDRVTLAAAIAAGQVREPPAGRIAPHLQRALTRAFGVAPAARFPSMDGLLGALAHDPRARRRTIAIVAVAAVAVGGLGAGTMALAGTARRADACAGARTALGDTWTPARRDAIHAAFAKTGRPYAEATFTRVAGAIDGYAAAWTAQRVDACRAGTVRRDQPAALLALRDACLDARRGALDAVLTTFAAADAGTVDHAAGMVAELGELAACADAVRLTGTVAPPTDPDRRRAYDDARSAAATATALHGAAHLADALAAARTAVERADHSGDPDARALARQALAVALTDSDPTAARDALETGAKLAAEAHDDVLAALLWSQDVAILIHQLRQVDEADRLRAVAEAAAARAGSSPQVDTALAAAIADLEHAHGRLPAALAAYQRAIALTEAAHGPDDPRLAGLLRSMAAVAAEQEDFAAAHAALDRAERVVAGAYGPDHPAASAIRDGNGVLFEMEGKYEDARAAYAAVLASQTKVFGADSVQVATATHNLAGALSDLNRDAEARDLELRALAIIEAHAGPDSPQAARALDNLANFEGSLGRPADAVQHLQRALAIEQTTLGADNPDLAEPLRRLGSFEGKLGEFAAAERDLGRARELLAGAGQADSRVAAIVDGTLGEVLLEEGKAAAALAAFQQATRKAERALGPDHAELALHRVNLAGALDQLGRHADARREAARALEIATHAEGADSATAAAILATLAEIDHHLGHDDAARDQLVRALAILEQTLGAGSLQLAAPLTTLAEIELALGAPADALRAAQRARDLRAAAPPQDAAATAATARVLAHARRAAR